MVSQGNMDVYYGMCKSRGVKGFWIAGTYEISKIDPNCNCCGLRGDNVSS